MSNFHTILLLVFACGRICGSQIFGGGPHQPGGGMPPRGILHPDARGGNIIGGGRGHVGPGGRDHGIFHGGQRQPLQRPSKKDRIRMGPIVFDAEHLEHDDNDDYSDDDDMETAYQRPHLGLDLSNLLMPIINFVKFTGRSFSNLFHLLEKQANLLLGRKGHQGSISVTIVIAVSWLAIGLVVYALAQFAILRRMGEDEEEREEEDEQVLRLHQQCLRPPPRPSLQTTPPTPGSPKGQNGAVVAEPVKSIWLPSVGALQLSKSSILKRRESLKRRRKKDWKTKNNEAPAEVNRIRHCGSHIDQETRGWIENGLDRLTKDEKVRKNVLLKWNSFLHQHLMRPYVKDDLEIQFVSLIQSSLPSLFDIDVEMSDKDYLLISVSIEAAFEADLRVNSLQMKASEIRLTVSKLGTRLECKLARNEVAETVHLRQTGPVTFESDLTTLKRLAVAIEEIDRLQESLKVSIGNALKNVDCDLPPFHEICENSTDDDRNGGIFVESPSSFSSQSPSCQSSVEGEDYLHVSVLRASLEDNEEDNCCSFHPYVILEVDHPAQRFQTTQACRRLRKKFSSGGGIGSNSRIDFTWPESTYKFHISREKTRELLVELWESENGNNEVKEDSCCPTGSPCHCLKQGNISPSAVGHRLLGLCLVSVQDLMSTPSQHHLVSLQGRPFLDDTVLNWTINLRFEYVPDVSMVRPTSLAFNNIFHGVHKTLEMKQCLAGRQQPSFITNSSYSQKEESKEGNAVARAAVRDLQTQQSLRLGAPLATKSVLVIRAVQKVASPKFAKTPELVTPGSGCDDDDEREEEKAFDDDELAKKKMNRNLAEASEAQASPAAAAAASTEDNKLKAQPTQVQKRRGFLSTLRDRLYHRKPKNSSSNDPPSSVPSQDLSSSINDDAMDTGSSCSGRSSCYSEQSYNLTPWKGTLSTSWQSLASTSSTLLVPSTAALGGGGGGGLGGEDASSLSEVSGISINSSSGINIGGTPPPGRKNLTALILETVEDHGFQVHYLIPQQLAKKARLRKKGVKLHVCNEHLFMAKHAKSGTQCSVCQKKIVTRLGKKCYICRDCGMTCHKGCYDRTTEPCSQSSLNSMELFRGSTLLKKKGA